MPEFLLHHGYQSQPRGWVTEDDAVRDQWIALNYPVIPENVLDNKSDYGMDGVTAAESYYWQSYYTDGYTYYRQAQLSEEQYLNSPGVRVVNFPSVEGWSIEDVCKMYYKFEGVRNNIPNNLETAYFPNRTVPERVRQNQTTNIAKSLSYTDVGIGTFNGLRSFHLDPHYHYLGSSLGDILFFAKHSGWAWNQGSPNEDRQWLPNFSSYNLPNDPFNNYDHQIGTSPGQLFYKPQDHYWVARATFVGYVWEYAYQSDITRGNGITYTDWTEFGEEEDTQVSFTSDYSQHMFEYTHDISLIPFVNGPENASTSDDITDALFWSGGYVPSTLIVGGDKYTGFSQYSIRELWYNTATKSNEAEFLNKLFVAFQYPYSHAYSVPNQVFSLDAANYIKIPVTYWTTVQEGITFYHRRTGTSGIEDKINIELLFAS